MDGLEYSTENIYALADQLNSTLNQFKGNIEAMFTVIDTTMNSEDYWQGQAYEAFKNYCDTYKSGSIDPLVDTIQAWINTVNQIAQESEDNTNSNVNLFN